MSNPAPSRLARVTALALLAASVACSSDAVSPSSAGWRCGDGASACTRRPGFSLRPIAYLRIRPSSVTLAPGAKQQLTADAYDAYGVLLGSRTIGLWISSSPAVATVTGDGIVTAVAPGQAIITFDHDSFEASAVVTVVAPTSPPPSDTSQNSGTVVVSPVPSGTWPNQPLGYTLIGERAFNGKATGPTDRISTEGWEPYEYQYPGLSIVPDLTAPRSPSKVMRMLFKAGHPGGSSVGSFGKYFPSPRKEIYVSVWLKIDAAWYGHTSTINKMFYIWMNGGPDLFTLARGGGTNNLWAVASIQGTPDLRKYFTQNLSGGSSLITRGKWTRWELVVRMNTPGKSDGHLHWWIDGVKTHEYRDIMYSWATDPSVMTDFTATSVWGGTGGVVPRDQSIYWDHIYISGR